MAIGTVRHLSREGVDAAARELQQLYEDPIGFAIRVCRIIGTILLGVSLAAALTGYYLRGEATRAHAEAGSQIANIGAAWGRVEGAFQNLQAIPNPLANGNASITTSNVLTDVENFGSDVANDFNGVVNSLGVAVADLGQAIADIPSGLVAAGQALGTSILTAPGLIWNELVWGLGGTVANVLLWIFPYLAVAGAILWGLSIGLWILRDALSATVVPAWRQARARWAERIQARIQPSFDRLFGNRPGVHEKQGVSAEISPDVGDSSATGAPESRILATSPPAATAAPPGPAAPVAPAGAPAPALSGPVSAAAPAAPEPGKAHDDPTGEGEPSFPREAEGVDRADNQDPAESTPPGLPDGPASTEETEQVLGDYPSAKERMRAILRQQRGDLPPPPSREDSEAMRIAILEAPLEATA